MDDVKKLASSIRRNAKDERVLLHFNGHGVPRPTAAGELWVFNKSYTQYVPLPVADLIGWLGAPALIVLDCAGAGALLPSFAHSAPGAPGGQRAPAAASASDAAAGRDFIVLAACSEGESLPTAPELPADLFTGASCALSPP